MKLVVCVPNLCKQKPEEGMLACLGSVNLMLMLVT